MTILLKESNLLNKLESDKCYDAQVNGYPGFIRFDTEAMEYQVSYDVDYYTCVCLSFGEYNDVLFEDQSNIVIRYGRDGICHIKLER